MSCTCVKVSDGSSMGHRFLNMIGSKGPDNNFDFTLFRAIAPSLTLDPLLAKAMGKVLSIAPMVSLISCRIVNIGIKAAGAKASR